MIRINTITLIGYLKTFLRNTRENSFFGRNRILIRYLITDYLVENKEKENNDRYYKN